MGLAKLMQIEGGLNEDRHIDPALIVPKEPFCGIGGIRIQETQ
jgi:hypothetical protein